MAERISRRKFLTIFGIGAGIALAGGGGYLLSETQYKSNNVSPTLTPDPEPLAQPELTFTTQSKELALSVTVTPTPTATIDAVGTGIAGTQAVQQQIEVGIAGTNQAEIAASARAQALMNIVPTIDPTLVPTVVSPSIESAYPTTTATPVPDWLSSYLASKREWVARSENGLARIDMNTFRQVFSLALANQGLIDGQRDDFDANMLGTDTRGSITLSHALNFWINEARGLGWKGNETIYDGLTQMRQTGWENLFTSGQDGVYRFGVRVEAKDFDKVIAYASITRFLIGAGMKGATSEQLTAFLYQQDPKIRNLFWTLVSTTGYIPVPSDRVGDEPVVSWPGAQNIENQDYNLVSNAGDVCVTYLVSAQTRDGQRESSVPVQYRMQTEEQTAQNDETLTSSDSEGDVFLFFTFDPNAQATVGGSLSPNNAGTIRVDVIRETDIQDQIQNWTYAPSPDGVNGAWVRNDGGRWIPCGVAIQATAVPQIESVPQAPETTGGNGPEATQPPHRPTQPPQATPIPTNADRFTQVPPQHPTDLPPTNFQG